ncbi:MAG: 3-keto-5-aminohexanoate cleavage protein [Caldimonas sp.]|uniref:3-keto-5-aminohexanoate cleavage protein n=1 Tax=Caldimonas sp. TaxID=2838790 RepID=UPI00391A63B0
MAITAIDSIEPLIVTVAPNGAYKTTEQHPAVPLTPQALAQTAKACLDAGASMLHMHVRRPDGRHWLDAQAYREATAAVRRAVGSELVVQITTEAAKLYEPAAQMAVVREVVPEAVSVGLRELHVPAVSEAELGRFFQWLVGQRVMTQVILYDVADVQDWQDLRRRGVIPEAPWFLLFVLGRYSAGQTSSPLDLLPFVQAHDGDHPWAVCAFGAREHACAMAAAALGGHVRVGFENNVLLRDGQIAPDNAALVAQIAQGAQVLGRELATADQVRARFGRA